MRNVATTVLIVSVCLVGRAHGQGAVTPRAQSAAPVPNSTGILLSAAPMFLLPDAGRTPLATLAPGTVVRVVEKEGDWYKVVYHDSFLGDRTGYIRDRDLRVEAAAPPPVAETVATPSAGAPQPTAPIPPEQAATVRKGSSWSGRGYVSVNGTYQTTSNAFTGTSTFTQNVETGSVTTAYEAARFPALDVGGAARVWRDLAVGAAVTWLSHDRSGTVSASVPHPFLFNAPRTVTGTVTDVPRQELALHLNASWIVAVGRLTQIAIFGGPSYFRVTQGFVIGVDTSSVYPYDTATFVSATTVQLTQSQLGFNAGLDVAVRAWKQLGVGAIVRYSRASLQFPVTSSQEVSEQAGGLQVGGGVRFAF